MSTVRHRCAIYTRKSSEEGLDQDFNSLQAQREACEAFIASQRHEGWQIINQHYDDGGISGGHMDRPALQMLLGDIKAAKVDVCRRLQDRPSDTLADGLCQDCVDLRRASRLVCLRYPAVHNTTTSMGRLTLNVLLSFAQFEREVTGERIRDKIAASKKKGMWMGGLPPLGYDIRDKKLVINESEAETVRTLFELYLKIGSVRGLKVEADARGLVTKKRQAGDGFVQGGKPFSRGHLYQLLCNPIYVGKIAPRKQTYPGQHDAIIGRDIWDGVQTMLGGNRVGRTRSENIKQPSLLTGLIYDETGDRLSPTHAIRNGRRYRYYISHRLMQARRKDGDGWRLPADQIEKAVLQALNQILSNELQMIELIQMPDAAPRIIQKMNELASEVNRDLTDGNVTAKRNVLQTILKRITIGTDGLRFEFDRAGIRRSLLGDLEADCPPIEGHTVQEVWKPIQLKRRGIEAKLLLGGDTSATQNTDRKLIKTIANAHFWFDQLASGVAASIDDLAAKACLPASEISRVLPLAFLAPRIVAATLDGQQPIDLTSDRLKRMSPLPVVWKDQEQLLQLT